MLNNTSAKATNTLKQIENVILFGLIALFPVFLLPSVQNPVVTAKLSILAIGLVSILILKAIRNITSKSKGLVFATSSLDLPILLLTVAYIVSGYLVSPNRLEAFWLPGSASFIIGGAVLYFVLRQLNEKSRMSVRLSLIAGGAFLAFYSVLQVSGILKSMQSLPAYLQNDVFSPAGSVFVSVIVFIVLAPMVADIILHSDKYLYKVLCGIAGGLFVLAFIVSLSGAIKNWNETQLPTLSTSWVVATESLKLKPFTGVGAGNYLSAFSRFIPISYNATPQWSTRFSNASNFYLTAIAETGLLGLASLVVLMIAFYKTSKKSISEGMVFEYAPAILMIVSLALFPGTPVLVVLFFITLALSGRTHIVHMFTPAHEAADASTEGKFATFATAIPLILISVFALFLVGREVKAEVLYQKALNAVSAQDGKLAYDTLQSAINTSPYNDRMHLTYSQLNLLLANSLTQKKTLSDDEKNTISQLVQQAVREGRAAVALNIDRSGNWVNLGSIYRAVIPLAKGADQFALQTYSQAIVLDPINPNVRVALGGVYYGLKRYEEAIDVFRLATSAKPDFANAHYNVAIAYRDNGQYDKSLAELTGVLSLVQKDSADYQAVQKEIENVKSKAPQKAPAPVQTDNLTPPTKIEENKKLQEKIALPNEATPTAVVSPTPVENNAPEASPLP